MRRGLRWVGGCAWRGTAAGWLPRAGVSALASVAGGVALSSWHPCRELGQTPTPPSPPQTNPGLGPLPCGKP